MQNQGISMRLVKFAVGLLLSGMALTAEAASFRNVVYHGRIVRPGGEPVNSGVVGFTLSVYSPSASNCLLYSETQSQNMTNSMGTFSLNLGEGTYAAGVAQGSLSSIWVNAGTISGSGCSYSPAANDERVLKVTFNDAGNVVALDPMSIRAVPYAIQAEQVSGYGILNLAKISGAGTATTLTPTQFDFLANLANPASSNATPCTAGDGLIYDGTNWICQAGGGGGGVTSVTSANADIGVANTTTTPVLTLNSGTAANQILKLDGTAKIPAVDGSQITNLNPGNLSAAVPASKGGTGLTALGTANQVLGVDNAGTGTEYKTITAGSGVSVTHGANSITIAATGGGGTVTSVTGTSPIISSGGTTPAISLDTGLGASKIPQVGGTALGANGVIVANGTATALTSLNCTVNQVIKFDASGYATCGADSTGTSSQWTTTGSDIYYNTGNVGIGTATPSSTLEISGNLTLSKDTNRTIRVANSTSDGVNAGDLNVYAGSNTGNTTANGGSVNISAGTGKAAGSGGSVNINAGQGGLTGATAGSVNIYGGHSNTTGGVAGGSVSISAGFGTGATNPGGDLNLSGGSASVLNNNGGSVYVNAGAKSGTGSNGNIILGNTAGNVGIGTTSPSTTLDVNGGITARGIATGSAPATTAGQGKIYFDSTANKFKVSENNGAYVDLVGGGGGGGALSALTAATGTNTIDNLLNAQTWNWSTATTETSLTMNANALTTGSMLSLATSNASLNSTNGLLNVANTGASTSGVVARIQSNSTAGSGVTVLANGNVGVGTTSPVAKLQVYSPTQSTALTDFTQSLGYGGIHIVTDYVANAYTPGLFWSTQNNSSSFPKSGIWLKETASGTNMYLGTSNSYGNGITNQAISIDPTGNVGIGTTSPSTTLDVNGGITARGIATGSAPATTAGQGKIYFDSTANKFKVSENNGAYVDLVGGGGGGGALSALTAATGTNTIDNLLNAQTWNWSTATTETSLTMNANALTTGSMLSLATSNASLNSTNGLLNVANTGASTSGVVARIQSNSTAGSGVTVLANGSVGIGTASPSNPLSVIGDVDFAGSIFLASGADRSIRVETAASGNGNGLSISAGSYGGMGGGGGTLSLNGGTGLVTGGQVNIDGGTGANPGAVVLQSTSGNVGIGTTMPGVSLDLSGRTDSIRVPAGTTAQRPATPANGDIRYNSTLGTIEGYMSSAWTALNNAIVGRADITATPYTVTTGQAGLYLSYNNAAAGVINLPSLATLSDGWQVTIMRKVAQSVTITPNGADSFPNGITTLEMQGQNLQSVTLTKNGSNWAITDRTEDCISGQACWGANNIYLGIYNGKQYFTTPGGCTDSATPTCAGGTDTVTKAWATTAPESNTLLSLLNNIDGRSQSGTLAGYATANAAKYCENMTYAGYTDWYLPSRQELNFLYQRSHDMPVFVYLVSGTYWSSTEDDSSSAFYLSFNGYPSSDTKTSAHFVRCVRRF